MEKGNPDLLVTVSEKIMSALTAVAGVGALLMMAHVTADVAAKLFFNHPITGTLEVVSNYYMVAIVFLPIALIDWTKETIAAELVFDFMPMWMKSACVIMLLAVMAISYLGFGWFSLMDALTFQRIGEAAMGSARIVIWPARYVLVAGIATAALVSLLQLYLFVSGRDRQSWLNAGVTMENA